MLYEGGPQLVKNSTGKRYFAGKVLDSWGIGSYAIVSLDDPSFTDIYCDPAFLAKGMKDYMDRNHYAGDVDDIFEFAKLTVKGAEEEAKKSKLWLMLPRLLRRRAKKRNPEQERYENLIKQRNGFILNKFGYVTLSADEIKELKMFFNAFGEVPTKTLIRTWSETEKVLEDNR